MDIIEQLTSQLHLVRALGSFWLNWQIEDDINVIEAA